jgi:hypothetical protein
VAVEKLVAPKFTKITSRQDALQTTFSVFLDICYPPNLAAWDEKGVFQQPRLITTVRAGAIVQFDEVFPNVDCFGGTDDLDARADDSAERERVDFEVEESGRRRGSE